MKAADCPRPLMVAATCCWLLLTAGCTWHTRPCAHPLSLSRFVSDRFDWSGMRRVLLVGLANESQYPQAAEQVQRRLAAELQAAGLFEVVTLPPHQMPSLAHLVRTTGQFDERTLLELRRQFQVDGLLVGTVTQYRPYQPLRIGMVLHLISVDEAVVVASVDGIWDCRDRSVVQAARCYSSSLLRLPADGPEQDRVLQSPNYFQRFVCNQVAKALEPVRR